MTYSIVHTTSEQRQNIRLRMRVNLWIVECALTILVVSVLVILAGPLAKGSRPLGLDHRYSVESVGATVQPLPFITALNQEATMDNKRVRAEWLNEHAGAVLTLLASCGLLTLYLGRKIVPSKIKLPLIVAWWSIVAQFSNVFCARWIWSGMEMMWILGAVAALILAFVGVVWTARFNKRSASRKYMHSVASPWVYPGFVLFSGLGWIWLMDWAARGHLQKQFVGIYQFDSLWIGYFAFTLIAAHQGQLLAAFSRLCSWLDRLSLDGIAMPNVALVFLLLLWAITVGMVSHVNVSAYAIRPDLLVELVRMPVWLTLGWILYRGLGNDARWFPTSIVLVLLLAILVAEFNFDHTAGSILAQAVAILLVLSCLVWGMLRDKLSAAISAVLALVLAVAGTVALISLGIFSSPESKLNAIASIFHRPSDFGSVMHWLQNAIPITGFGIGTTSWCGYTQMVSPTGQCLRAGVPDQIQSDYVLFAMITVWGAIATVVILCALFLWLKELVRSVIESDNAALNISALRQWMVMGFVVTCAVQILVHVISTLDEIGLNGFPIPMLSFGGAGLISTAIFAALAVNVAHFRFVRNLKLVVSHGETKNQRWDVGRPL